MVLKDKELQKVTLRAIYFFKEIRDGDLESSQFFFIGKLWYASLWGESNIGDRGPGTTSFLAWRKKLVKNVRSW